MNKRLDVARWAIQVISPQVRTHGSHHPATAVEPSHWVWDKGSIHLVLTEHVLPHLTARPLKTWSIYGQVPEG